MPATFDGDTLVITLPSNLGSGVLDLSAQVDLYSDWKEWLIANSQRQGFPPAFRTTGGDVITTSLGAGAYYFFRNDLGWRIRPFEEDGNVFMVDNLIPQDSTLPMVIPTIGAFTVLVLGLQPITQNTTAILDAISTMLKIERNNQKIDAIANTLTVYEDDGVTPLYVFDLKDSLGAPSSAEIFERQRQ